MARVAHETLSIHRSFVVRLYPPRRRVRLAGRVEQAVLGEPAEFRSGEELVAILERWQRTAPPARTRTEV